MVTHRLASLDNYNGNSPEPENVIFATTTQPTQSRVTTCLYFKMKRKYRKIVLCKEKISRDRQTKRPLGRWKRFGGKRGPIHSCSYFILWKQILLGSDLRVSPAGHQLSPDPDGSQHPGQFPQRLRGRQGFHPQLSGRSLKVLTVMTQWHFKSADFKVRREVLLGVLSPLQLQMISLYHSWNDYYSSTSCVLNIN